MADSNPFPLSSLTERKRRLVQDELAEAALKILAEQGFDETTVDQIVAAAGMSRRTFSRYFQSKEDVIVHKIADAGIRLCAELRARPADELPTAALRYALAPVIQLSLDQPGKMLRVCKLILGTPALLGRFLERLTQWQAGIAEILAQRTGLEQDMSMQVPLAAAVAVDAFLVALRRWADSDGSEALGENIDQALAMVAPVVNLRAGTG